MATRREVGAAKTQAWIAYQRARIRTASVAAGLQVTLLVRHPDGPVEFELARSIAAVLAHPDYLAAVEDELAELERYETLKLQYEITPLWERGGEE